MANALIRGKATPTQITGSTSTGINFQSLSNAPIFIGFSSQTGAAVSASSCDGVIQPGGSYRVEGAQDVFLYADVDSPLVYNYGAGASTDAGNTTNVAGTVAIAGTVPVAGNVGVTGTVPVSGGVAATPLQSATSLAFFPPASPLVITSSHFVLNRMDVSAYTSITFRVRDAGSNSWTNGLYKIVFNWFDANNQGIAADEFTFAPGSQQFGSILVKGQRLEIYTICDGVNGYPQRSFTYTISGLTNPLPEFWRYEPAFTNVVNRRFNLSSVTADADSSEGVGLNISQSASQFGYYQMRSRSGRLKGNAFQQGGQINIAPWLWGQVYTDAPYNSAFTLNPAGSDTAFEVAVPRCPLIIRFANTTSGTVLYAVGGTFTP